MKYRYTITNEGTVEADDEEGAKVEAWDLLDNGMGLWAVEVEPLNRERDE